VTWLALLMQTRLLAGHHGHGGCRFGSEAGHIRVDRRKPFPEALRSKSDEMAVSGGSSRPPCRTMKVCFSPTTPIGRPASGSPRWGVPHICRRSWQATCQRRDRKLLLLRLRIERVMTSAIRFTASWFAAWCQVLLVALMPLGPITFATDALGDIPICHAGTTGNTGHQTPSSPDHHQHDCVLCCVCQAHGWAAALVSPAPVVPTLQAVTTANRIIHQARAPPFSGTLAAQPRGPPSLT
jgi:Protein of unknown function (DUF2946)